MRIVCPSCSATYDVPDSLVTAGRVVRCARCGSEWAPVEPAPAPEAEPPAEVTEAPMQVAEPAPPGPLRVPAAESAAASAPRMSAMDRLAARPAWPQSQLRLRLAWAASLLVVVLAVLGAYAWRTQIVTAWPPSARLYAAFGMHPGADTMR